MVFAKMASRLSVLLGIVLASMSTPVLAQNSSLNDGLDVIRKQLNLPGAAAVVMRDGKVIAEGVTGLRRLGTEDKIQIDDRFAIGSCTKRMTGLMIGRVIDEGKLGFDVTLAKALADVPMRDEYRNVTLQQLLTFTGGIPAYERIGPKLTPQLFDLDGSLAERQAKFIRYLLQEQPVGPAGKDAVYSNASYTLAAQLAVKATGKDYESLMDEKVFRPLGLKRTGWGRPWQPNRTSEPWLHLAGPEGYVPEPDRVRPPEQIFQAAGNAHMSVRDFALFAQYELNALQGKDGLLKPATSRRWHAVDRAGNEPVIRAGGTPALSACYALWPKKNLLVVIAVNGGSPEHEACKAFVKMVSEKYAA
ncbi:MAG: beta-lactamase family protein [Betaproteobacteria bacterium]|nr:beta-lactamase family protein [Betaproteobacteria bacterium]